MKRFKGSGIPSLEEGESDQTRSVQEWAEWRIR